MSFQEIILKILLFFGVFYGAIAITAFVTKHLNLSKEKESEEEEKPKEEP